MGAEISRKHGIVFAGGGAKGAYQIGVWRYLRERRRAYRITGVSGASIGAINSLLFAQGDYHTAVNMWLQARQSDLVGGRGEKEDASKPVAAGATAVAGALFGAAGAAGTLTGATAMMGLFNPLGSAALLGTAAVLNGMEKTKKQTAAKGEAAQAPTVKRGSPSLFRQDQLEEMIRSCIDREKVEKALRERLEVYTALTRLAAPHMPKDTYGTDPALAPAGLVTDTEYRCWRGLDYDELIKTVLASAAYPLAYPVAELGKEHYIDGGVLDNAPATPLIEAGYRHIIVVHLEHLKLKAQREKEAKLGAGRNGVAFYHVWPSKPIGETFDISAELTRKRMDLGYWDAMDQLKTLP